MRRLKNDTDIEKIKAVFFEVGKSLPLIPLIAHSYYVHNLCLHVKRPGSPTERSQNDATILFVA